MAEQVSASARRHYINKTLLLASDKNRMMTSSNGNLFRITGPLSGESTGHRWIPLTKASNAELWYFLWSAPEQTADQTIKTPVIWEAIALIMTSLYWPKC